jgi:hypothetical protein
MLHFIATRRIQFHLFVLNLAVLKAQQDQFFSGLINLFVSNFALSSLISTYTY